MFCKRVTKYLVTQAHGWMLAESAADSGKVLMKRPAHRTLLKTIYLNWYVYEVNSGM